MDPVGYKRINKATGLTKKMTMDEQLVADMSASWAPRNFTDSFKEQIL